MRFITVTTAALLLSACPTPTPDVDAGAEPDVVAPDFPWEPGQSRRPRTTPNSRGFVEKKGLIHAHSIYSHDACDGMPADENGVNNLQCLLDFRDGVCRTQQDFVMLTDHNERFGETPFPDVLLFDEASGDVLLERDGQPVANWMSCGDDQEPTLLLAGSESAFMFVGTEGHAADTLEEASALYGDMSDEAAARLREQGALVFVPHTEDYTVDDLVNLPLDGFEMFNIHANLLQNTASALDLILRVQEDFNGFPQSDLTLLRIYSEDPRYLDTWSQVLARGVKRVTTMGSDCHRNSFPGAFPDGERMDSYRRMMAWFTNHLLVDVADDGSFTDRDLKDALKAGRLFGVFEAMGQAEGFDFHAAAGDVVVEMGGDVSLDDSPTLVVQQPRILDLPLASSAPEMTLRVLRATDDGWVEVASTVDDDLEFTPTEPGAYRAEVRLLPHHLEGFLGDDETYVMRESRIWIYANPIYVQ